MTEELFWHVRPSTTGRALLVFPYLGGFGASLRPMIDALSGDWDVWAVNPPGHGPSREMALHDLDALVERYVDSLIALASEQRIGDDVVLFGHSMGGVLAFHVTRVLQQRAVIAPRIGALVLSASAAPPDLPVAGYAALSDQALLAHLMSFDAFPAELASDPELVNLFLPSFRADYAVLDQARTRAIERVDVPVTVVLGERDVQVPEASAVAWQAYFTRPVRAHLLPGAEHMFVHDPTAVVALDAILRDVRRELTAEGLRNREECRAATQGVSVHRG